MYTVNQGPSKLVAKTRTGLSQNYESIRKNNKVNGAQGASGKSGISTSSRMPGVTELNNRDMDINLAKPVFQHRTNSNRSNSSFKNGITCFRDEEPPAVSPQYEELIRYIRDSWNVLSAECEAANEHQTTAAGAAAAASMPVTSNSHDLNHGQPNGPFKRAKKVVVYHNEPPSPALDSFGPFDLESWWGRRLFNSITKSL